MRRLIFLVLLMMALPMAAFARQVDVGNNAGTLTGTDAGLTVPDSILTSVRNLYGSGLITGNLGTVAFQTGALTSGSLQTGGTFAAGGAFTVTGNGSNGVANGPIFTGTFYGDSTWQMFTLPDGTHNYNLTGIVTGIVYTKYKQYNAKGVTFQLTVNTGTGFFNGSIPLSSGNLNILCSPGY
ncbi:MAG TPA: hypothetical protein VK639_13665 [Terriglobales bacterium]|nr:hypothetical protein [Terriglobales bacterium]